MGTEYFLPPEVRRFVERVAPHDLPVLLLGERGTGKTVLSRLIHEGGPRRDGPFVRLDVTSVPPNLVESELFGHVRGAFTGADQAKAGLIEAAHGGSLVLDEIDALPSHLQRKLLTVFEEGVIRRVGSAEDRSIDLRLISATNADLGQLVRKGRFRQDLLDRILGLAFRVPSLRERIDELPELCQVLLPQALEKAKGDTGEEMYQLNHEALELLRSHSWPGNLRELRNVLSRAVVFADGPIISADDVKEALKVPSALRQVRETAGVEVDSGPTAVGPQRTRLRYKRLDDRAEERRRIVEALRASGGLRAKAAESLGMSRTMLWRLMKEYGVTPDEWQ